MTTQNDSTTPERALAVKANVRGSLQDRIRLAYRQSMGYHDLMRAVFPPAEYPQAWNTARQGGPPGCAMAFNSALRRMGAHQGPYPERRISLPNERG